MGRRPIVPDVADKIAAELADPASPWHQRFPTAQELCDVYDVSYHTVSRALPMLGARGVLVRRKVHGSHGRGSRERWLPPEQGTVPVDARALAATLRVLITSRQMRRLPTRRRIAATYRVGIDTVGEALQLLAVEGFVVKIRPEGVGGWRWVLAGEIDFGLDKDQRSQEPAVRAIALELIRRCDTGWYRWTGVDGHSYERPFPSRTQIMAAFRCSQSTAQAVIFHLVRLGYVRPGNHGRPPMLVEHLPPPRFLRARRTNLPSTTQDRNTDPDGD
jgi:DNA-binding GntR family transcriptional regulator